MENLRIVNEGKGSSMIDEACSCHCSGCWCMCDCTGYDQVQADSISPSGMNISRGQAIGSNDLGAASVKI